MVRPATTAARPHNPPPRLAMHRRPPTKTPASLPEGFLAIQQAAMRPNLENCWEEAWRQLGGDVQHQEGARVAVAMALSEAAPVNR